MPGSNMSGSTRNTPLPPSVEKAYWRKCIELKKRITEIEESNNNTRNRVRRLDRGIRKMRIERAFLLERLTKIQKITMDESDKSTSPPPTPRDRPPRMKRRGDRRTPVLEEQQGSSPAPVASTQAQPYTYQPNAPHQFQHHSPQPPVYQMPTAIPQGLAQPPPPPPQTQPQLPAHIPQVAPPNLIHQLPPGTCVMLQADGNPKGPPWTLDDLDPKHRYIADFDSWSRAEQENSLNHGYAPIDVYGQEISIWRETSGSGRFRHAPPNTTHIPAGWSVFHGPAPPPPPTQVQPARPADQRENPQDRERASMAMEQTRGQSERDHDSGAVEGTVEASGSFRAMNRQRPIP